MPKYYHPDKDWFVKHDLTPPSTTSHGVEADIMKNISQMKVKSWRLEGNKLIGEADAGRVMQTIPTDYICKGTDKNGLPILEKIVLSN